MGAAGEDHGGWQGAGSCGWRRRVVERDQEILVGSMGIAWHGGMMGACRMSWSSVKGSAKAEGVWAGSRNSW